ncbi:OprD family porin [Entomomonas sp. E2T0]|uniref:OprD family porin n=1 Tax=Entomomonas sp. E2T0 TaxID=2930213 RepID=UPI00222817E4|nr:OprD family porin [Entomomonas sp. E2T0]UYZ83930.1 OprD family porin [Entomomonas sp. E2T0]
MNKNYYASFKNTVTTVLLLSTSQVYSYAEGFWEDADATLTLRNYYFTRNFPKNESSQNKSKAWTQSFIFDFKSGYTQGAMGFGLDVLGLSSFKLDAGKGSGKTSMLPIHDDGKPAREYGRLAAAGKFKLSKTELKVGEWVTTLPILRADDGRSLPQTFQGAQLTSNQWQNTTLYAGQMRGTSLRNDASMEDMFYHSGKGKFAASDRFNFSGIEYNFNDNKSQAGAWFAQLKDVYKQGYFSFKHEQQLGSWQLRANTGYFIGKEDGNKKAGELDNKVLFGLFSAHYNHHTFYVGLQRLTGDSAWMRVTGSSGGTLANDSFANSYDNPQEKSWQLRYDYNFTGLGITGLTMMHRYFKGSNVHTLRTSNGREWGRESELAYTFQQGALKNLSIKWRFNTLRQSWNKDGNFDEHRIIFNYPISFL